MWASRSHTLVPLTNIKSIKVRFKWTKIEQNTFNKIKRIVDHDTLLTYSYFNEEFKIHTNDSNFQLGAVISQKGKPIDFYSRKLTNDQIRYAVTERELLSTVETIK